MASSGLQVSEKTAHKSVVQEETEIDLIELLYRLLEKAKYIIAAAVLGAVIAIVYTLYLVTPTYTATSKLYVLNGTSSAIDLSALQIGTQLASDYKEVFSNWHVHERVIEELDLPYTYTQLNKMVSVSNAESSRILHIKVESTSAQEAKLLADTYARVAQEFIAEKMSTERPNIFEEARVPAGPSSPSKTRNVIIGFMLGAIIAAGVFTVQFLVDDRIHSDEDITKYIELPVLGMMPDQRYGKTTKKRHKEERKQ